MQHRDEHKPEHGDKYPEHADDQGFSIIVNGREKTVEDEELTFDRVACRKIQGIRNHSESGFGPFRAHPCRRMTAAVRSAMAGLFSRERVTPPRRPSRSRASPTCAGHDRSS